MSFPPGYQRVILDQVDSTMAEARRRASDSAGPVWIMARAQSAAQGRRGRAWVNPRGNLAATLLMRPDGPPSMAALRSFLAGLAVIDALAAQVAPARLSLKWPNDVLLDGGKLAGILLESRGAKRGRLDWLSIGIGINLVAAPAMAEVEPGALAPVSVVGQGGPVLAPEAVLDSVATAFARYEAQLGAQGFEPLRRRWLQRAARLGETITARLPGETLTGTFETIDETGQLVLRGIGGPRLIPAAEVFFP
ncbi:MAG: biotin--[acetyl-CoA-carboxylase] ligase [Pseudomonadota bacterium]